MSRVVATLLFVIVPGCLSFQQTSHLSLGTSNAFILLKKANVNRLILPLAVTSEGNDGDIEQMRLGSKSNDLLEDSIDSFLRGEYDFKDDALSPLPEYSPKTTVENAVTSLRALDDPEPCPHGAAVLLRFCAPLSRGERWGGGRGGDTWKELLRGSLTPTMLAKRLQVSQFSGLLDFCKLDVMDGALSTGQHDLVGLPSFAFVNVALYFEGGKEPQLMEFKLVRNFGVWLIDSVKRSEHKLFSEEDSNKK
ncbi:unnamed protein product [Cylindrotheca closterium]|uniref:Uncharacterized protein n=1 Tax=Cylindrotheca closterium TaxID=2856 RepID=A0AAD2CGS7_9STRA|nr:unnamed protein product [Cylindrotheca closterium]